MPYVNTTEEFGATRMMEDILKAELKKMDPKRATFMLAPDTERLLSDADQLARVDRLNDRFSKFGTLDSSAVGGLDSLLMVDAILLVKISEGRTTVCRWSVWGVPRDRGAHVRALRSQDQGAPLDQEAARAALRGRARRLERERELRRDGRIQREGPTTRRPATRRSPPIWSGTPSRSSAR